MQISTLLGSQQQVGRASTQAAQPKDADSFAPLDFKKAAKPAVQAAPAAPAVRTAAASSATASTAAGSGYVRPGTHLDIKV